MIEHHAWLINHLVYRGADFFPVLKTLDELAVLPAGWRFGEGAAPDKSAIQEARTTYLKAMLRHKGFVHADASPLPDGGVSLDIYELPVHIEIYFHPGNILNYTILENDSTVLAEDDQLDWAAIDQVLEKFEEFAWNTYDSSTKESSNLPLAGSIQGPFKTQPAGVFPYSVPVVQLVLANRTATMSLDSIRQLQESHRFYGDSRVITSQKVPA